MAKSTSLTDFIGTVAGIDDRITRGYGDFTVDLVLRTLGGDDTLVTFRGAGAGNKIILHDVTVAQLEQQGLSELFTFGA